MSQTTAIIKSTHYTTPHTQTNITPLVTYNTTAAHIHTEQDVTQPKHDNTAEQKNKLYISQQTKPPDV